MDTVFSDIQNILPISLDDGQKEKLEQYTSLVLEWNEKLNLTAITGQQEFWYKHILDSLTILPHIFAFGSSSVIDVGTGPGFPGIPLKIAYPEMRLTLCESIRKKADFCQLAVDALGPKNVSVFAERAEILGQNPRTRESYDWAIARAVAPLSVLAEYLLPLVHIGGQVLAQKSGNVKEEISIAEKALKLFGGEVEKVVPVELPKKMGSRTLVIIKKIRATPAKFPRRPGAPKKKPIV